jgi:hypothetical protein
MTTANENYTGLEHLTAEDLEVPKLKLAQAMSPQLEETDADYNPDLRTGDLWNSITGEIYPQPVRLSVLVAHPWRAVEYAPLADGGGVIDADVPRGDPRLAFPGPGEKPIATELFEYTCYLWETREILILSLSSTAARVARQFNCLMALRADKETGRRLEVYEGVYELTSVSKASPKGTYRQVKFRNAGSASSQQLEMLSARHHTFKKLPELPAGARA